MTEYRAQFDAVVEFSNGGSLRAEAFRIDVPSADVTSAEVATRFIASLGLLLTARADVTNVQILEEPHAGTRAASTGPAATSGYRTVELNHVVRAGMITYPGLPAPSITPHLTRAASREIYAAGTEFAMDIITLIGNTGTYVDSPYHRFDGTTDLAGLPLDRLHRVPTVVIRIAGTATRAVDENILAAIGAPAGSAVLIHSGDDVRFGTPEYARDAAFLTRGGAEWLVANGAAVVGIDAVNIDSPSDGTRPAHSLLLGAGIPVVEHLTGLAQLPPRGALFSAIPPRVADFGTFPVRAFAEVPQ